MRNNGYHILLIIILCAGGGRAQDNIDSLELSLQRELPDTSRISVLISLSREYQYTNINKSRELAENALKIAEGNNFKKQKIRAYQNIGSLYAISGDYSSALRYDNLALQNSLEVRDSANLSINYNNVASDYYDLGEFDEAYYYFTQSFRIAKLIDDSLRMAIALHNVGRVFKELGQYDRALAHLGLSMEMSRSIADTEGIPYSLDEIGDVMLRKGDYDSALTTLLRSVDLTRRQKLLVLEPKTLAKLATVFLHSGNFDNALAYYDTTYRLHERTGNEFGIAEVELGRGQVYIEQGKYDEAMQSINRSMSLAKNSNARTLEIRGYHTLSGLYELKKDYQRSLDYFKQFKQLEDSLFSQDMQAKLLRDQIRFETEDKDTEIAALNQERSLKDDTIKKQEFVRNILVVVMALSVILLATVYRSGQRRRQINTLLLQHQQEMETRSEELERLNQVKDKFFSIISHDLRSPINALSGLLDLMDKGAVKPEELSRHVHELKSRFTHTRTLLNNLLDWTLLQMDKLSLQPVRIDIHKIVDENIQLLKSIPNKQISLHNEVAPETMGFADSNTVNLVIRNLITNAIKFTNDGGEVVIAAQDNDNQLLISVQDNGVGMKDDVLNILFDKTAPYTTRGTANEKGTGLGLILCKEFVEKNGGRIFVESEEGKGSKFSFTIPKPQ